MIETGLPIAPIVLGVLVILVVLLLAVGYVKAPTDKAFVITGIRGTRFLIGKAGLCIPFLEQKDEVTLELIKIDVETQKSIPTKDCININVDSNVNIKVGTDPENLAKSAQHFLNKDPEEIVEIAKEVLEGNIREIVGKMDLREMIGNREKFSELVSDNVKPDLKNMGLELVSFNVQNFRDEENVIVSLGIDNIEKIKKEAAIAKANARRDVDIAEANAKNASNEAQVKSDTIIAERNNELEIKRAELKRKSDAQKAIADKSYEIEIANQQKTINIVNAEAETAKQEKLIAVREKEIEVTEKELHAQVIKPAEAAKAASIIKAEGQSQAAIINAEGDKKKRQIDAEAALIATQKSSDASKYEAERKAEAELFKQQRDADAELFKQQKAADASRYNQEQTAIGVKAMAEANLEAAKAEAQGIEAKGKADGAAKKAMGDGEASAIAAKGLAEAEALDKKAEAMKNFEEAAKLDMQLSVQKEYIHALPQIADAIGKSFGNVGKIEMFGTGSSAKLAEEVSTIINQIGGGLGASLGIDGKMFLNGVLANLVSAKKELPKSDA